jgi:hypothetical protein
MSVYFSEILSALDEALVLLSTLNQICETYALYINRTIEVPN